MRLLKTGDIFKVMQIFKAANLKDDFAEFIEISMKPTDREEVGAKFFSILFDCLGNDETEPRLLKLLSDISGKKVETIESQPIQDTIKLVKDIISKNDVKSFFKQATL